MRQREGFSVLTSFLSAVSLWNKAAGLLGQAMRPAVCVAQATACSGKASPGAWVINSLLTTNFGVTGTTPRMYSSKLFLKRLPISLPTVPVRRTRSLHRLLLPVDGNLTHSHVLA